LVTDIGQTLPNDEDEHNRYLNASTVKDLFELIKSRCVLILTRLSLETTIQRMYPWQCIQPLCIPVQYIWLLMMNYVACLLWCRYPAMRRNFSYDTLVRTLKSPECQYIKLMKGTIMGRCNDCESLFQQIHKAAPSSRDALRDKLNHHIQLSIDHRKKFWHHNMKARYGITCEHIYTLCVSK